MRKVLINVCVILIVLSIFICGCSNNNHFQDPFGGGNTPNSQPEVSTPDIDIPDFSFETDLPDDQTSNFSIVTEVENGYVYNSDTNTYTITVGSSGSSDYVYNCYGNLYEGRLIVDVADNEDLVINLNGCTITNSSNSPIYVVSADKVEISAIKGTENFVYDLREYSSNTASDEDEGSAAIYADADLKLKGTGTLTVVSNYNNGIHTKKDLEIQKETLTVKAVNNGLKGNDSVTINSGTITVISSGGDAIKTKSTDYNKDGTKQRGRVDILDGTITLFSACDGIDSASDVTISGGSLTILTDEYSEYSGDVMTSNDSIIYLRTPSSFSYYDYKYSAYFYNTDGTYKWVDSSACKKVTASTMPGGRPGGPGGFGGNTGTTYYYYEFNMPKGFTNVKFYIYSSSQAQSQMDEYVAVSINNTTIPASADTYIASSISTSSKTLSTSGWTSFQSSSGNTGLDYSCKGIKADNVITISGGTVNIYSKDDGIHANFDSALTSTGKNGLGNICITGGSVTVSSCDDGIHADQDLTISGGTVNVKTSYEGLEANRIYISDGNITVYATDDGVNANSKGAYMAYVEISGGYLDVAVPSGDTDTIDSNGKVLISGGFVFIKNGNNNGQSMTGGTFDTDNGVTVTGGTVISIGCIGNTVSGSKYNTSTSFSSGDYTIKDSSGNLIASFTLSTSYKAYMFWSDKFVSGTTYTVYKNGSSAFNFTK